MRATLLLIIVAVALVGCGKKKSPAAKEPVKEPTLEEKLVGAYELDGNIIVFQKSGMMESYAKGRKEEGEYRWKIVDKEVHAVTKDEGGRAWGINPDGSLIYLAVIQSNGNKLYLPRLPKIGNTDYQPYWKKITNYKERIKKAASLKKRELKTEEKKAALNSDDKNSTSSKPLAFEFSGKWLGKGYRCGSEGPNDQLISISQKGKQVVATKIKGDKCIRAGEITWQGEIVGNKIKGFAFGRFPGSEDIVEFPTTLIIHRDDLIEFTAASVMFHRQKPQPKK